MEILHHTDQYWKRTEKSVNSTNGEPTIQEFPSCLLFKLLKHSTVQPKLNNTHL